MRTSVKLALTALAASLLLSTAISTASARNLSITNQNFRITWTSLEFIAGAATRCLVTLEGSFHYRTILKNPRSLIGLITKARVQRPCIEGTGSAFNGVERYNGVVPSNSLPWHVTYEGFSGTLPRIEAVLLLLARPRFGIEIINCAIQVGEATDNITLQAVHEGGGGITELTPVEGRNEITVIRTDRDPFGLCLREGNRTGRLRGVGQVFLLGSSTTRISVTLI